MLESRDNISVQVVRQADQGARRGQCGGGVGDGNHEVLPLNLGDRAVDGKQAHHLDGEGGGNRGQVDWVGGVGQPDREGR